MDFLRVNKHLKPVNICNLFERFQQASNNTVFFVYNTIRDTYEIHSIKSFLYDGESINAVIEDDMLNGWILNDFKANDVNKFGKELEDERNFHNTILENNDNKGLDLLTQRTLKTIETMVGREI